MKAKLVRDKIPEVIENETGKKPKIRILSDKQYAISLDEKLKEEVKEYLQSKDIEELADINEVILAIIKTKRISRLNFEKIITKKAKKKGRFNKKISLISY